MTIDYPGSTEVVKEQSPLESSMFFDGEEHDVAIELMDDIALLEFDEPLEFSIVATHDDWGEHEMMIELEHLEVDVE